MTKGFITIATGEKRYFELARNLLRSYRMWTEEALPFSLLCDEENEYTHEFDTTIVLESPMGGYLDKLQLYDYAPYDETIFIDADCLAYEDLNRWFKLFEQHNADFSVFGYAYKNLDTEEGWFNPLKMNEYTDYIDFVPAFNGAAYFIRKSNVSKGVFRIANEVALRYDKYGFKGFTKPADEPLLALGMAVYGCEPLNLHEHVFVPRKMKSLDIAIPEAVTTSGDKVSLVHWSNYLTRLSIYRHEALKLNYLYQSKNSRTNLVYLLFIKPKVIRSIYWPANLIALFIRIKKKITRTLNIRP